MKHITTKFDKEVYLEVLPQMRLIKQVLVKFRQVHLSWKVLKLPFSKGYDIKFGQISFEETPVKTNSNAYHKGISTIKSHDPFYHVVLQFHVTNQKPPLPQLL